MMLIKSTTVELIRIFEDTQSFLQDEAFCVDIITCEAAYNVHRHYVEPLKHNGAASDQTDTERRSS